MQQLKYRHESAGLENPRVKSKEPKEPEDTFKLIRGVSRNLFWGYKSIWGGVYKTVE